jgi:hypothetical protein
MKHRSFGVHLPDFEFDIGVEVTELFGNTAKLAWDEANNPERLYVPSPGDMAWADTIQGEI